MSRNQYRPAKVDNQTLKVDGIPLNIKAIGCMCTPDEILQCWDELEKENVPINSISALFVGREEVRGLGEPIEKYAVPLVHHLIKLVDSIAYCKSIKGSQPRINDLKSKLRAHVAKATAITDVSQQKKIQYQVIEDVLQTGDELRIACILHRQDNSLEFTTGKGGGPDFKSGDKNIKIEAKSKLNREFVDNMYLPDGIDEHVCKRLMARDAFKSGVLEKAFDKQQTDIAVISLSHSEYGVIFAAYSYENNVVNYTVEKAFAEASNIVKEGKKAVILYTEVLSAAGSYHLVALACDKDSVEQKGAELDREERKSSSPNREAQFFRIIEEAKKLEYKN